MPVLEKEQSKKIMKIGSGIGLYLDKTAALYLNDVKAGDDVKIILRNNEMIISKK